MDKMKYFETPSLEGINENCFPSFYNDEEDYEEFIKRTRKIEPDPEKYEFLGKIEFNDPKENHQKILEWEKKTAEVLSDENIVRQVLTPEERVIEDYQDERFNLDHDLGTLVSADGRVYKQKLSAKLKSENKEEFGFTFTEGFSKEVLQRELKAQGNYLEEISKKKNFGINIFAEDSVLNELIDDFNTIPPVQLSVLGSDGRTLVTSSQYPWRAVGVALIPTYSNSITGSGAMIGPRHILTAAHVITSNGSASNLFPVRAAAAARGTGFSGNRWPFGRRYVQWYYWPKGFDGGSLPHDWRYDYAVLILEDINWSPGWVSFGYQTTSWLDFKKFNSAGYPGNDYTCKDSPLSPMLNCGGYMYRQYADVKSVFPGHFYHKFDTQKGQSGCPIYYFNGSNTRIIYGINIRGGGWPSNVANRIRKGSFKSICSWVEDNPSSHFSNVTC